VVEAAVPARELATIYRRLVGARIRAHLEHRTSFVLFTIGQVLSTVMDLLTVVIIFGHVTELAGWTYDEVLFLYGASTLAYGLSDLFASPVEHVPATIKSGSFDRFLLRPVGPLLQVCAEEFALRRAGRVVQPAVVLAVALYRIDVEWTLGDGLAVAGMVVTGAVIFSALWVLTASVAFWTVEAREMTNAFTYGGSFIAQYPLDVLGPWLRRLVLVVPMAFVAYLPGAWILGKDGGLGLPRWAAALSPAAALALCLVAAAAWRMGVRHYRSTGT
jgi:ABC-2 type transport system permease protein